MGFLSPWFLAALAALGLPVFVHLLRRQVTIPRPVSSLMFFEQGTQSSTRHRRLRYLLLFALRFALLLLLILAFANPFIRRANAEANGRLLLIVVDNSFSMRAGSRFADAKQGALKMLEAKPLAQRAQIMALGSQLQVLTQPIQDKGALRAALESIQPGDSEGNFGELGRGVRALAEAAHPPIDLHLFSDMQRTNMPANFADMALSRDATLVLHQVGKLSTSSSMPNWTITSIDAPTQLADIKDPRHSRVRAVITGYQTPAVTRTIALVINGKTAATRKVDIPANGSATVEFQPLDVPYGFSRCAIRIEPAESPDSLPADDMAVFSVHRSDPERVLFIHQAGDFRSPLYFGAALSAAAQSSFLLQSMSADQATDIDPSKYAFIVLSDAAALPSIFEHALIGYVHGGGSVLIAAGTTAGHHARIPVFDENVLGAHAYARENGFARVGSLNLTDPVLKGTSVEGPSDNAAATGASSANDAAGGWSDLRVFYATVVDPAHSRVIARLADGTPLLLDKQLGEGHVLLFTSGLDNLTNDLPLHPFFVSFVDQAARYLSGGDRLSGSRLVDSFVQLRSASTQAHDQPAGVEVIDPDGHRPLSLSEASSIQSFRLSRAGFYQVRFANGRDVVIGVNPDRRESNLEAIPDDVLKLWGSSADSAPSTVDSTLQQEKKPYSLWWYVMLFALLIAVAESIIASNYLGTLREEP
jgi:hypothetical protein